MSYSRRMTVLALLIGSAAHAQAFEDPARLDRRIASALGAGIGEAGGAAAPVDRRLRLAACPAPTVVDAPAIGAATVRCEALGWRIRVPLVRSAEPPHPAAARPEPVIRKGDQVELTAAGGGFQVSTLAIAEQDAAPGERIRVRPDRKAAAVIGVAMEDGRVALPGFK